MADLWELKYFTAEGKETTPEHAAIGPVETAALMGKEAPSWAVPAGKSIDWFKTQDTSKIKTGVKEQLIKSTGSEKAAKFMAETLGVSDVKLQEIIGSKDWKPQTVEVGGAEYQPASGVTIPISQQELLEIAQAKAKGQCVGAMEAYYTVKLYKVSLKDGSSITVQALNKKSAEEKAKEAGYDVAWVTKMFGGIEPSVKQPSKSSLSKGQQWVKDFIESKGAWKDEYLTDDGFNLLAMYEDSVTTGTKMHPSAGVWNVHPDDLRKIFGRDAIRTVDTILYEERKRMKEFEEDLETMPAYFQEAYKEGGLEGYNEAVNEWNRLQNKWKEWDDLQDRLLKNAVTIEDAATVATKTSLEGLPASQRRLMKELSERWERMSPDEKRKARQEYIQSKPPSFLADYNKYLTMFKPAGLSDEEYAKMKPHMYLERDAMVGIDIVGAVKANVSDETVKKVTGVDEKAISEAKWVGEFEDKGFLGQQKMLIDKDPEGYAKTMAGVVGEMGITLIPVYGTWYMAQRPEKYGVGWTVASGVTDALVLVAGVGAISKAVKLGVSLPRAIASAGFTIARDTLLTPYTVLRHPLQTVKGIAGAIMTPMELVFKSKAMPLATVWRGTYSDGFSIAKVLAGSPDEALATQKAMAKQFQLITEGKATSGKVVIPGFGELKFSATGLQKKIPDITFHATPFGMHYKGVGVDVGEGGLFTADQALLGLDQSSATGQGLLYVFKGKKWLGALDETGRFLDTTGQVRGGILEGSKLIDLKGRLVFRYGAGGQITDKSGNIVGLLKNGSIYSDDPAVIGRYYKGVSESYGGQICTINKQGMLVTTDGKIVGKASEKLVGFVPDGTKIGGVGGAVVGKTKAQPAFVMITTNGVSPLPEGVKEARSMAEMEKLAWRAFKSGDATSDLYPVFKQYAIFIEDEGFIPKGTKMIPVLDKKGKPVILTTRDITGRKIEMPVMQLVSKEWFNQALAISRELAKYPTPAMDSIDLVKILKNTENIPKKSVSELLDWLRKHRGATLAGSGSEMVFSNGKIVAEDWDIVVPNPDRLMGNELASIITRTSGKQTKVIPRKGNIIVEVLDKGLWKKAIDIDSLKDLTASWEKLPEGLAVFGYRTINGVNIQTPASQMTGLFDRMSKDFAGKGFSRWYRYASALRGEFDIGIGAKPPSRLSLRKLQARGIWNTVRDIFVPVLEKVTYEKIEPLSSAEKAKRIAAASEIAPDMVDDVKKLIKAEDRIIELARKYRSADIGSKELLRIGERLLVEIDKWRRMSLRLEDSYYTRAYILSILDRQVPLARTSEYEGLVGRTYRHIREANRQGRRGGIPGYEYRRMPSITEARRLPRGIREDIRRFTNYEEIPRVEDLERIHLVEDVERARIPRLTRKIIEPEPKKILRLVEEKGKKYYKIPDGSIAWKQGMFWKYIPPPWAQEKPISLKYPPEGAKNIGERTPRQTIQMIGKPKAKVPKEVSIDLGVVDIMIRDYGRRIEFKGGGLETVVGKSLSTPTKGMSIPATGKMAIRRKLKRRPSRKLEAAVSL